MASDLPNVKYGTVDAAKIDWRNQPDPIDPDDDELDETPPDVIAMLGFDPKELQ